MIKGGVTSEGNKLSQGELQRIVDILHADHPGVRDSKTIHEILASQDFSQAAHKLNVEIKDNRTSKYLTALAVLASGASSAGLVTAVTIPTLPILSIAGAVVGVGIAGGLLLKSIKGVKVGHVSISGKRKT
ncbi:MAG TPA: hypothetical protein VL147_13215 [Devosia sp.]|nr:hypothetical protein [Devosia sp.]